jgi:vancomycin resistance protein YoaR
MLTFGSGDGRGIVLGGRVADAYFAHLQTLVARPAYGARFAASGSSVDLLPAQSGRALDVPRSAAAVLTAAEQANDRVARLVVDTIHVGTTTAAAQAMGITGLVGSYETVYGGVANRIHNVQLVSHLINGKLIAPGATFSFNRATGARTAAKGFLVAPVIINGELSTGLGGGVCQVSTTVFNAAFVAGLPITDRTNHALYISHYPLGRDATVDYPNVDLRFVNNTPHWLLLRTYVGPTSLTVSLFGTPQHRRVVSQTAPLTTTGPMPIAPRLDSTLAPGERVVIEPGMPPTTTSVHRWVYAPDGKLLSDSIWYSSYRAVPEVVLVGPRRPPPPPPKTTTKPSTTTPSTTTPASTTPASTTKTPTKSGAGRPVSVQERFGNP